MPATKKRPPLELEPGEGKAHEMAESTSEELREGAEPDDAPKPSRKRSAKGAKRTKAPMDGDCKDCDGDCSACAKKKAMKDGDCGLKMKRDGDCPERGNYADCATCSRNKRSDSLTPQEYLAACDLGIQGRSRAYIRARLVAAPRPARVDSAPAPQRPAQLTLRSTLRTRNAVPAPKPNPIWASGFLPEAETAGI